MKEMTELLSVSSARAFNFFYETLYEEVYESGNDWKVTKGELAYVASILAHYSQVSIGSGKVDAIKDLSSVFDTFFLPMLYFDSSINIRNSEVLEVAGSYTLLFAGFFRNQSRFRHNLSFYDSIGQTFYREASFLSHNEKKANLMCHMSENFPDWVVICGNISRSLRDNRFLLRL